MIAFGCVPRASVWPWARWVEAKTSPSSSAWQTPTPTASWPIPTSRSGAGPSPEVIRRLLARLDREGIDGRLVLVAASEAERAALPVEAQPFVPAWDELLAALPDDWSDLYAEVELLSSDYLERAALLMAPLNPARYGGKPGFRFRVARRFGYGASPEMARRCLQRVDEEGARGAVRILRALSDTRPVQTQGPVWYVSGHVV